MNLLESSTRVQQLALRNVLVVVQVQSEVSHDVCANHGSHGRTEV